MSTMPMSGGYADYDIENQQIERRRKMAEMLAQQSGQALPTGAMVGNQFVPTSWTQHLAQALKGPLAERELSMYDKQQKDVMGRKQADMTAETQRFAELLGGKPAGQATQQVPGASGMPEDFSSEQVQTPAVQGDRRAALAMALAAKNPMLQQWGMSTLTKEQESPYAKIDPSKFTPESIQAFAAGGGRDMAVLRPREKIIADNLGGKLQYRGEYSTGPLSTVDKTAAPAPAENPRSDLLIAGPDGKLVPNQALIGAKQSIAKAGAAAGPVVNVNTATKPFLNELGKGVGESVVTDFNNAKAAAQTLQNATQIESGLSKVMAGPGANARIKLAQIGEVLGVNGKDTTEMLQNTRTTIQGLARQELAAAGQMKGQGQITESERGILRRAESGDISEMTVPELRTLLGAVRKTANYRINQHNQNLTRLQSDPNAAGVVDFLRVNAPGGDAGSDEPPPGAVRRK